MGFEEEREAYRIALLVAIACVLQIAESLIPHPIPGLRLGLAGMVTLIALVTLGFRRALEIAILRTLLSSFVMGTFMSPPFILSFTAAIGSTLVMGGLYRLAASQRRFGLSIVGVSIGGALSHNLVQLALAYVLLVRHPGILALFPWLAIGAVGTGWVTGATAAGVCRKLRSGAKASVAVSLPPERPSLESRHYLPGEGFLHRTPAAAKIAAVVALAVAALALGDLRVHAGLLAGLVTVSAMAGIGPGYLLTRAKRFSALLIVAFLLPLLFSPGGETLLQLGPVRLTGEGLRTGGVFALRILFLMVASSVLVRTTSPENLTRGLARVLLPLRILGVSERRVAAILAQSWSAIPVYWETARERIRTLGFKKVRNVRGLIPLLSDFIAALYLETEQLSLRYVPGGAAVPAEVAGDGADRAAHEGGGGSA